jgi:hypothetical protein
MKHTTIRLAEHVRVKLAESAGSNRRTLQAELCIILEDHFGLRSVYGDASSTRPVDRHSQSYTSRPSSDTPPGTLTPSSVTSGAFDTSPARQVLRIVQSDAQRIATMTPEEFTEEIDGLTGAALSAARSFRATTRKDMGLPAEE